MFKVREMGRRQAVRHLVLVQASGGSNPSAPVDYKSINQSVVQKITEFRRLLSVFKHLNKRPIFLKK